MRMGVRMVPKAFCVRDLCSALPPRPYPNSNAGDVRGAVRRSRSFETGMRYVSTGLLSALFASLAASTLPGLLLVGCGYWRWVFNGHSCQTDKEENLRVSFTTLDRESAYSLATAEEAAVF